MPRPRPQCAGYASAFCVAYLLLAIPAGLEPARGAPMAWVVGYLLAWLANQLSERGGRAALLAGSACFLAVHTLSTIFSLHWGRPPTRWEITSGSEILAALSGTPVKAIVVAGVGAVCVLALDLAGAKIRLHRHAALGVSIAVPVAALTLLALGTIGFEPMAVLRRADAGPPVFRSDDVAVIADAYRLPTQKLAELSLCSTRAPSPRSPARSAIVLLFERPEPVEQLGESRRARAPGAHADQALAAVLAGLPALTAPVVASSPQPRTVGLGVGADGHRAIFAAGSDLAYHQRARFVRGAGFTTVGDTDGPQPRGDAAVLAALEDAVRADDRPFLAVALLLGDDSHVVDSISRMRAAHADALFFAAGAVGAAPDFTVPLVAAGINAEAWTAPTALADIPATIRDELGLTGARCGVGRPVTAADPVGRVLGSVDLRDPKRLYLHTLSGTWTRNVSTGLFEGGLGSRQQAQQLRRLAFALHDFGRLAVESDWLAPPNAPAAPGPARVLGPGPVLVAHRGVSDGRTELGTQNRIPAMEAAISAGFEWLEVDVARTVDGAIALVHDLDHPTPQGRRPIRELSLSELRALPKMANLSTLQEAVDTLGARARFLIDIKATGHWEDDRALATALGEFGASHGTSRFLFQSYDITVLDVIKRRCPGCTTGWLVGGAPRERTLEIARESGVDFLTLALASTEPAVVDAVHSAGLRVFVYTASPAPNVARLRNALPDAFIVDRMLELPR